ncbi:hypothetical protein SCUCBS95973_008139 [Sporothrix curviconia]|uniref:Uncharacterized protein n=1 Tax=Sporothrix curviconia TaxID=1260050 RepID=A0ABP0CJ55_9PEZI
MLYYPSTPRLLGRTSGGIKEWFFLANPPDRYAYPWGPEVVLKAATAVGPMGRHLIHSVWTTSTLDKVQNALTPLDWTSIDVLRMGEARLPVEERTVVVWVGVNPQVVPTTQWELYAHVLRNIREALDADGLQDVECELRASRVSLGAGPRLLLPAQGKERQRQSDHEAQVSQTVATTVGQSISPQSALHKEGTLGLYLAPAPGHNSLSSNTASKMVWGLTCHHVVLPEHSDNVSSTGNGGQDSNRLKVVLPGAAPMQNAFDRVNDLLDNPSESKDTAQRLGAPKSTLEALSASSEAREIGYIYRSPPMAVDEDKRFTKDWALVALDKAKFPPEFSFENVVDIETDKPSTFQLRQEVRKALGSDKFIFPPDGQMRLKGVIPPREILGGPISHSLVTTRRGDERLIVLKRGRSTDLTAGVALDVESVVRTSFGDEPMISSKWTIIDIRQAKPDPNKQKLPLFSETGDSGAIVFDLRGRVGGMITVGTSATQRAIRGYDLTYATPFERLYKAIELDLGHPVYIC